MPILMPIAWGGDIPGDEIDFSEWTVTGTIESSTYIAFDEVVEDSPFTMTFDILTDLDSGMTLNPTDATWVGCGGGVFKITVLIAAGGAYFRVYPSTYPTMTAEGILTDVATTDEQMIRDAVGLTSANLAGTLTTIYNKANDANVNAMAASPANQMSAFSFTGSLDTKLLNLSQDIANISVNVSTGDILTAFGTEGSLDNQLDAILAAAGGLQGSTLFTWTERQTGHENDPQYGVPDVTVLVYSNDEAIGVPLMSGVTDEAGVVQFYLDPGTYYLFRRKAGRNFVNPETIEVT